jgi:hypothetical protein
VTATNAGTTYRVCHLALSWTGFIVTSQAITGRICGAALAISGSATV